MKFTTITLLFLLLFSCTKQEDPIINFTVTQNWWGQIVLTANLEKITPKNVSVVGFSAGMSSNHYIQENQVKTDPHSPGMYRAVVPIQNVDAFYKAFDIKKGDKMYIDPDKRVKIW